MRRIKPLIFYLLFLAILIEGAIGYGGYRILFGEGFSYSDLKTERREIVAKYANGGRIAANLDNKKPDQVASFSSEIIHPYLGYVVDFHDDECPSIGFCDDRSRGYQKTLAGKAFFEPAPHRAIIAIVGGSFAYGVGNSASKGKLEAALARIPEYQGKEIIIYTFALGGWKQPQPLFAIQYYLSMGVHFDMIINIDGFNDTVLPQLENIPVGTSPYFPRLWHQRVRRGSEDRDVKLLQGRNAYLEQKQAVLANTVNESVFSHSALKNLVWRMRDAKFKKQMSQAKLQYLVNSRKKSSTKLGQIATGMPFETSEQQPGIRRLAQFWRRSSELLHSTAKGSGIRYYHFLQPNQYVANSKAMTQEERKVALLEGSSIIHPYASPAKRGYPYLILEGKKLTQSAVPFYDLTPMFKENNEVLYVDACCHLNSKGYDHVIDKMVEIISAEKQP